MCTVQALVSSRNGNQWSSDAVVVGSIGGLMALVLSSHLLLPGRVSRWAGIAEAFWPEDMRAPLCFVR